MRAVEPVVDPLLAAAVHPSAPKMRAIFAVERGAIHEIATLLGPDPVPRSRDFTWMVDVCITAELAAMARLPCRHELYQTLMPFKGRVVTMDGTFICFGAASYYLGLLAASLGWADRAHDHFDAAIDLNDAIGAIPWSRRARAARRAETPLVT